MKKGQLIIEKIKKLAKLQQNGFYTDGPGYNDHSGNPDHNRSKKKGQEHLFLLRSSGASQNLFNIILLN